MTRKKHAPSAIHVKPTALAHPALVSLAHQGPSNTSVNDRTVNTLLTALRRTQRGPRLVPPAAAVQVYPPPLPPLPPLHQSPSQAGSERPLSPRARMAERRRARPLPGPRPPPSWGLPATGLDASLHARPVKYLSRHQLSSPLGPDALSSTDEVSSLSPAWTAHMPSPGPLQAAVLSSMARRWAWHAAHDGPWLGALPASIREQLLVALAEAGQILLRADLAALITGRMMGDESEEDQATPRWPTAAVAESWEDDAATAAAVDAVTNPIKRLTVGPSLRDGAAWRGLASSLAGPPPVHLTHLSLAAAPAPSWSRLLTLTASLPHLTHLDLAGWPTPGSTTEVHAAGSAAVVAGAAGLLAGAAPLEQATLTLRRLGHRLSGLQWLGLDEGAHWWPAWTVRMADPEAISIARAVDGSLEHSASNPADEAAGADADVDADAEWLAAATATAPSPTGLVDFARAFPRLRTLRLSSSPDPALAPLLASEATWAAAVARYTFDPAAPFPPRSPLALLRVPEPVPGDREYEGPRWLRGRDSAGPSTEAYTLQQAQRLPAWRAVAVWCDMQLQLRGLETRLRRARLAGGGRGPLRVERGGIDDATALPFRRAIVERWEREH